MSLRTWLAKRFRTKSLGERGEDVATRFLKKQGYAILTRHLDLPQGELDIIAVDGRTVVFVEVKTRQSTAAGTPTEAIDDRKQQRMSQAALVYLKSQGLLNYAARFDVIAILWPADERRPTQIEHIKNAFEVHGRGQFFA